MATEKQIERTSLVALHEATRHRIASFHRGGLERALRQGELFSKRHDEGKAVAKLNAVRHGILSEIESRQDDESERN